MRILALALLLGLTACSPNGASNAAPQDPQPKETVPGEPVEPQPQPVDSAATAPVPAAPAETADPARGEPVEPQPQPVESEPTDPKGVQGEPVEPQPRPEPVTRDPENLLTQDSVDYSCKTAADCEVKNVGNCCGYYPACVNKDSPTFPDKVKAACAAEGMNSICGFPEIGSCSCVEGRCAPVAGPGGGGDVR